MRRFVQAFSNASGWPSGWAQAGSALSEASDQYNIGPGDDAWVVRQDGGPVAERFRWGLVPAWSKAPETRYTTVTARLDRAARSRIFGRPWRSQHCVVPMSGYYKFDRSHKPYTPHFIQARDGATLYAAGLWERWGSEDELYSFSILTYPNPAIPAPLTPDGPVFLNKSSVAAWLEGLQLLSGILLKLARSPPLSSYAVSKRYRDRTLNDYTLLEPASVTDHFEPVVDQKEDEAEDLE